MIKNHELMKIIKFGLENQRLFTDEGKNLKVRDVLIRNTNAIECQFYTEHTNSHDIKGDIVIVMSWLNGLLGEEPSMYEIVPTQFVIRAFDNKDVELLYAISSKEATRLLHNGDIIGWMRLTIFQENTPDYRLGLAKTQISEIENSLRYTIVSVFSLKHGGSWWSKIVDKKIKDIVENIYKENFGFQTENGSVLINYTFLIQLKTIICENYDDFKNLFNSKKEFSRLMERLNIIRREEGHNRVITEQHIADLKIIYENLLDRIAIEFPSLPISRYLVDNWRMKIKEVMNKTFIPYTDEEISKEMNMPVELSNNFSWYLNDIKCILEKEIDLQSIPVPIQKKKLHEELLTHLKEYRTINENIISEFKSGKFDEMKEKLHQRQEYSVILKTFQEKFLFSES